MEGVRKTIEPCGRTYAYATRIDSSINFCLKQTEKVIAFSTGILRAQNLEVVSTKVVGLADLIKRVVSLEWTLERASSLQPSKTDQKRVFPGSAALTREAGPISR
jgi:hypothetical protein